MKNIAFTKMFPRCLGLIALALFIRPEPVYAAQPARCTYTYQGPGDGRLWGLLEKNGTFTCQKTIGNKSGKGFVSLISATLYGERRQFVVGNIGSTDLNVTDGFYSVGKDCMTLILRTGTGLKICAN